MSKMKYIAAYLLLMIGVTLGSATIFSSPSLALNPNQGLCEGSGGVWAGGKCINDEAEGRTVEGFLSDITNVLLYIIGAVAVVMLVIGGIKYTTSAGDQQAIKSAKDTIFYSIIGIVVAFLAYAVVNFIVTRL